MSTSTFASSNQRMVEPPTQSSIQKMLDENIHLIQTIVDYQSKGKNQDSVHYQQILHRNLVYLATIADSNQSMQNLLTQPPNQRPQMNSQGPSMMGGPTQQPGASQAPNYPMQNTPYSQPSQAPSGGRPPNMMPQTNQMIPAGPGPQYNHQPPQQQMNQNMPQNRPMQRPMMGNYQRPMQGYHQQQQYAQYSNQQRFPGYPPQQMPNMMPPGQQGGQMPGNQGQMQ